MRKKFLAIVLVIFFSLGIFWGGVSLAVLNAPTDTQVIPPVGEGSARVGWQWTPGGGTISKFVLSYREKPPPPLLLKGTVKVTNLSTSVVGTGTSFNSQLTVGDSVKIGTEIFRISAIIDDTRLTLDSAYQGATASGLEIYKIREGAWTKNYPPANHRDYMIMGLTENEIYEWTIMAEAVSPAENSSETSGPNFTTLSGGGGNGGDGGGPPPGDGGPPAELTPPIAAETLEELFTAIINFLFYLAMALAPLMIIWAAFLILTAAGQAEQVNKGKTIILWTLVAVAIVLLAKGLPAVVKGVLGG